MDLGRVSLSRVNKTNTVLNNTKTDIYRGLIAHRGLQSVAPEDTLKAIREAGRYGFAMVEIDTQPTSDGYWILMHDSTVNRTTNGTGTVLSMTLAEIQALVIDIPTTLIDSDEVFKVPLLEDVLKECRYWGLGVNIDGTKFTINQTNVEYIASLLEKYNLTNSSFIVCSTKENRILSQLYAPKLKVGWVSSVANATADIAEAATYNNNAIVAYSSSSLTDAVVAQFNTAGVEIFAYTANTIELVYKWMNKGITYIETDLILPGGVY